MNQVSRIFALALLVAVAVPPSHAQEAPRTLDRPEFHVMGFGGVSYISNDGSDGDGFAVGQAVAHLSAVLGPRLGVFGEATATGKDSEYEFEIERLIVKYDFSDRYKLSAGRYHTPIGYWNSAYHHGAWLQTSASRPEMVKFGSQIVPIHFVGVLLEGNLPSGNMGLNYKVGFGNGRHANIARAGDAGDVNSDKAWMVQLGARPRQYLGLDVGIGFYADKIDVAGAPAIDESTFSMHVGRTRETPEVIIEYLHSEHDGGNAGSGATDAWYAHVAYRLSGAHHAWKPYARIESTDVDDTDPLLSAQMLDYDSAVLGIRWDFNPFAALKFEYRNEKFADTGRESNFALQVAFVLAGM